MRRPRPHRLTGSAPRLVTAAAFAVLGGASVVTVAWASSATPRLNGQAAAGGTCVLGIICVPTPTPLLAPLPTLQVSPLLGPTPTPLPVGGVVPTPGGGTRPPATPNAATGSGPSAGAGSAGGGNGGGGIAGDPAASGSSGAATLPAGATISGPGGLTLAQPGAVAQLTPLAGISFGQAPYLWPLFLLLDLIAVAALVLVVRKSWSAAGAD